MIKIAEIKGGLSDGTKFTQQTFDESVRVREGDLLFSWSGQPETSIDAFWWRGPEGWLNQHVFRVTPEEGIHTVFFYYLLRYLKPDFIGIARNKQTTGLGHVTKKDLENLEVAYPELPEQRAIAHIFGTLDDKIELNRRMNRTLEAMAQAIFKSWFVDFEPVKAKAAAKAAGASPEEIERAAMAAVAGKTEAEFDQLPQAQKQSLAKTAALFPHSFQPSPLGEIPTGWTAIPLYNTATFINGAAFKSKDFSLTGDGIPIVKIAELKAGITAQTKFTTGTFAEKVRIADDEMLYSWSGSPKTSLEVFKWFGGDGWLNQHIFRVCTESDAQKYFVFYLLRQLKPRLIAIATDKQTTGLGHVTVADMQRLLVAYPERALLASFGNTIQPLYEAASNNEKQTKVLAELRDTLLPNLLSGELSTEGVIA